MNNYVKILKNNDDLIINFDKDTEIVIVTGIPGSGKSHTSTLLSKKLKYELLSIDMLFDWEERKLTKFEIEMRDKFLLKYPKYKNYLQNRKISKEVCNKFFDFIMEYLKLKKQHVIFDSAFFSGDIPLEKFQNQRIIVKRTSFIKSFFQANKRDVLVQYTKDIGVLKKLFRTFYIPLVSLLEISESIKKYQDLNSFIKKIQEINYI